MTAPRNHAIWTLAVFFVLSALLIPARASRAATLSHRLDQALADPSGEVFDAAGRVAIWVEFADRGERGQRLQSALVEAERSLSAEALARRTRLAPHGEALVDEHDLPVDESYLAAVAATGATPRRSSRYLNAGSFDATPQQIAAIQVLPFVKELDLVAIYRRTGNRHEGEPFRPQDQPHATKTMGHVLDYGASYDALSQINVPILHDRGFSGRGVIIALLDTGFELHHEALQGIEVLDAWDFVDDDPNVGQGKNDPEGSAEHGTEMLGVLAGYSKGNLIGPAFGASVLLARTEDIGDETVVEEDAWIAALEWAEARGADIISSSVGYYYWYEFADLDGNTARITVAADLASLRGTCIVTSAGNERYTEEWQHIIAPADGDHVIAVGGVDLSGFLFLLSSPGPTADGRIKPDVMAQANRVMVPFTLRDDLYVYTYGVDAAVPLVAGVVALMLEADPRLTPLQVRDALRETASRAVLPDNDYGWGVVDAYTAQGYWMPQIQHDALGSQIAGTGPGYPVRATVSSRRALIDEGVSLAWRVEGGDWRESPMTALGQGVWEASIPASFQPTSIEYYITATDEMGTTAVSPLGAPQSTHVFVVGSDTTPPELHHVSLSDQALSQWPPRIRATATDDRGVDRVELLYSTGGAIQGPFPLQPVPGGYELDFPIPAGQLTPGTIVRYSLMAWDEAADPNSVSTDTHEFEVVESRGRVLLVSTRYEFGAKTDAKPDARGAMQVVAQEKIATSQLMAEWIRDLGFEVTVLRSEYVVSSSFLGYDLIVFTAGNILAPLSHEATERALIDWVKGGGRVLVEGGDFGYTVLDGYNHQEFGAEVLHMQEFLIDDGTTLFPVPALKSHPLLNRPNTLPERITVDVPQGMIDYGASDVIVPDSDATVVMQTTYGTNTGGVIVVDDNTGIDAGQIVYLPIDLGQVADVHGRALLENAVTYLTMREAPGPSSISGTVLLEGASDHSGTLVRVGPHHEVETAADGSFQVTGLWGGRYPLTIEHEGHTGIFEWITLEEGEARTGLQYQLRVILTAEAQETVGLAIPDNSTAGLERTLTIDESGSLTDIEIDIDISHYSIGNLQVSLISPSGTSVVLFANGASLNDDLVGTWPVDLNVDGPGSLEDFVGEPIEGEWRMKVADLAFGALGVWNSWGLRISATPGPSSTGGPPLVGKQQGITIESAPNPFNPRTSIQFELVQAGRVHLEIYDLRGRLVRRLVDSEYAPGGHRVLWNGCDDRGAELASGTYFARLRVAGAGERSLKLVLVR